MSGNPIEETRGSLPFMEPPAFPQSRALRSCLSHVNEVHLLALPSEVAFLLEGASKAPRGTSTPPWPHVAPCDPAAEWSGRRGDRRTRAGTARSTPQGLTLTRATRNIKQGLIVPEKGD